MPQHMSTLASIFFTFLVFPPSNTSTKMLIAYGEPVSFQTSTTVTQTWSDCLDTCLTSTMCMVVYQLGDNNCQIFEIGDITSARKISDGSGNLIAIKAVLNSSICPVEITGHGNGYDNSTGCFKSYTVTYSNPIWTFNSSSCFACPTSFVMFVRPKGAWCIRVIYKNDCVTQENAAGNCSSSYGGQLSGLEDLEEYGYVLGKAQGIWEYATEKSGYSQSGFWIDGMRKSSCKVENEQCNGTNEFTFSDPTLSPVPLGYQWLANQPDGMSNPSTGDCVALKIQSSTIYGVDDTYCNITGSVVLCMTGFVCGVEPSTRVE